MLRLTLRQARPGMLLARALADPARPETTLFQRFHRLTAADIAALHHRGVYDLWATCPELDFLDDLLTPELTPPQLRVFEGLKQGFHVQLARTIAQPLLHAHAQPLHELARAILRVAGVVPVLATPDLADEGLLQHSAQVAFLAFLLGTHVNTYLASQRKRVNASPARDLVSIGLGAFFHDFGDTQLPEKDREGRRAVSDPNADDIDASWHLHADLGYTLLRPHVDAAAAAVILHHHQRFDGSGFPNAASGMPQRGPGIHIFARIVAVADAFEHFLTRDQVPMPVVHALTRVQFSCRSWFDPLVLDALLALVPPFPAGTVVRLNDGRDAIVAVHQPFAPCCPQVIPLDDPAASPIDLAAPAQPIIQHADGLDVMPYLYGPRTPNFPQHRAVA